MRHLFSTQGTKLCNATCRVHESASLAYRVTASWFFKLYFKLTSQITESIQKISFSTSILTTKVLARESSVQNVGQNPRPTVRETVAIINGARRRDAEVSRAPRHQHKHSSGLLGLGLNMRYYSIRSCSFTTSSTCFAISSLRQSSLPRLL